LLEWAIGDQHDTKQHNVTYQASKTDSRPFAYSTESLICMRMALHIQSRS